MLVLSYRSSVSGSAFGGLIGEKDKQITFVKLHLLLKGESKKLLGDFEHLLLETLRDSVVDDLKEALGTAGMTDLFGAFLNSRRFARQEVTEVNNGRDFGW